jgi:peptidyl-prolyl cis-trans isomerase SurA
MTTILALALLLTTAEPLPITSSAATPPAPTTVETAAAPTPNEAPVSDEATAVTPSEVATPSASGVEEATPAGAPAQSSEDLAGGVVAIVNGDVITLWDIDGQIQRAGVPPDSLSKAERTARRKEALTQKVREALVLGQARDMGLAVTEAEVDDHLARIQRENNMTSMQLEENLKRMGFPNMHAYRDVVRNEMLKSHVVSVRVRARLKVTDAEVDEVVQRDYEGGDTELEIHCFHAMFRVDAFAHADVHAAARARLTALRDEIKSGAITFEDAARQHSDDVTSRDGGDLGWFKTGTLEESFEKVAFTLPPGELSEIVQTPFGVHIILVKENRRVPISEGRQADLKSSIRDRLYQDKYMRAMKRWFDQLEENAEVKTLIEL